MKIWSSFGVLFFSTFLGVQARARIYRTKSASIKYSSIAPNKPRKFHVKMEQPKGTAPDTATKRQQEPQLVSSGAARVLNLTVVRTVRLYSSHQIGLLD